MFYHLAMALEGHISALNVFQYLTFRTILGVLTALGIALLVGPAVIQRLILHQIGQNVRADGPESHLGKAGTPTMGGALILLAIAVSTLCWADLTNRFVWVALLVTMAFGVIGGVDDFLKLARSDSQGLRSRDKFLLQVVVALVASTFVYFTAQSSIETSLVLPLFKDLVYPLGLGFILLATLVIVGSSNAVNLTDGLDGLAIMPTVLVASGLAVFAYASGHQLFAEYLGIPSIYGVGELVIFAGTMVGAGLGFLWYNTYPAQVFMGDIGALSLGAGLGVIAVLVRQEVVLFIMGGIFVLETLSVMVQVISYKLTGRRVFRMAPLHHHYELEGWPEPRVIVRFWIVTVILVLLGLAMLKVR